MSDFKRENRYVIIKRSDMAKHLNSADRQALDVIQRKINVGRKFEAKLPVEAVIVENDWPMYNDVWGMIEAYVTKCAQEKSGLAANPYVEFHTQILWVYGNKYKIQFTGYLRKSDVDAMMRDLQNDDIARIVKRHIESPTAPLAPDILHTWLVAKSTTFDWLRTEIKCYKEDPYKFYVWLTA